MIKSNKAKIIIFTILLFFAAFLTILLNGNTYNYRVKIAENIKNIEDLEIELSNDVIKITDKNISDGYLDLKIESVKRGKGYIDINGPEYSSLEVFYVHTFGIITRNSYLGRASFDIVVPISVLIYIIYMLLYIIKKYKKSKEDNIYQYKNIAYLGVIIFAIFLVINQFLQILNYSGLIDSINIIFNSVSFFSILLLPVAVVVSIFVIINSAILLKKEGFTWKNMLGVILGIIIILATIAPNMVYNYLQDTTIVDIHNQQGIALYIYEFIENMIYVTISYLECVLLATIILGVKTARRIPKFNKTHVIILGCMIRKDGSLTPLLKSRVNKAIEFAKKQKNATGKDIIFVPSGGKGDNEVISEAEAIEKYLLEKGIESKYILIENKSTNTYENIKFSYKLIKENCKDPNIIFSTTNYHVFRAGLIASNEGIKIEGIGAKTKFYFWINAFVREFVATIYSERKKHFKMFLIIIFMLLIMVSLTYMSNMR